MSSVEHIVCVGDIHIEGTPTVVPEPLRSEAVGRVLDQAIDYCRSNGIFHIALTGDAFDNPYPSAMSYVVLMNRIKSTETQLTWYIISGNHDYENLQNNALSFLKELAESKILRNLQVYLNRPQRIYIGKLRVVFLPWPHKQSKLLKNKPSLVFAHVPRVGAVSDTGYVFEDTEENNWSLGKHFWMIGDVHKPQRGPGFEFVGSPLQMDFSEGLKRHFCHLKCKVSNGGLVKVKSERVPIILPYKLYNEHIETVADLDRLNKYDPTYEFIKVTLPPDLQSEKASITQQYPNVIVDVKRKRKKDEVEDVVAKVRHREILTAQTGGMSLRLELLRNRLTEEGFDKEQVKRGVKMGKQAELEAAGKR